MDTVCSIMGNARANQGFGRALDHRLQCRSQAASCVWLYEMQASRLVTSPPLTDPEPTGSAPDMAARTGVLASATSAIATPVG
jgi:hypothetical protein